MIDDRQLCVCGHPAVDHDHGVDCGRCEDCFEFVDQNDLADAAQERAIESQLDQVRET